MKRILSVFLSLCLALTLIPAAALAAGTSGTYQVKLNVSEDSTYQYNNQNVLKAALNVQSDTLTLKNAASIMFKIDLSVFDLLQWNDDADGVVLQNSSNYSETTTLSQDGNAAADGAVAKGKTSWAPRVYYKVSGNTCYIALQASQDATDYSVSEAKDICWLYLGFKAGKSTADLTTSSIQLATKTEANGLNNPVIVLTDGASNTATYGSTAGDADTLTTTPAVDWGSITLSKPAYTGTQAAAPTVSSNVGSTVKLTAQTITGERVEYACTTSGTEPTTGWQDSVTFSNLKVGTTYYFWARVKETDEHQAGTAVSAQITPVDKQITALSVSGTLTKTAYVHGDTFDPAGLTVTATYNDGTTDSNFTGYTVSYTSDKDYLSAGETSVKLIAGRQEATIPDLTVAAKALTITDVTAVDKEYDGTTAVTLSGGTLNGVVDGENVSFTLGTGTASQANAGKDLAVSVTGCKLTGSDAGNYTLTQPSEVTVTISQADPAIGAVTYSGSAIYPSTKPASVNLTCANTKVPGTLALDGVTAFTAGTQTYKWKFTPNDTDNYKTVTGSIDLTVSANAMTGLSVGTTTPTKTSYKFGETFDPTGLTVKAAYANGDTKDVTSNVTFGALAVGQTEITLSYTEGDVTKTCTVSGLTVDKADARTLADQNASQKYSVTAEQSVSIANLMPSDAGTVTYAEGNKTDEGSIISSWSVDDNGTVKWTIAADKAAGQTATLPVTITSANYADSTVNVVVTLTDKDTPTVTPDDITVTYTGSPVPASAITGTATFGSGTVAGAWSFKDTAPTAVAESGSCTVVFTPTDTDTYASVEKTIQVTISKAKPTGTPSYTAITTSGKTLADASLAVGTITPAGGTIAWKDADTTTVTANTSYGWTYTPADTDNYDTLTGSITVYKKSSGGGGGSGSSSYAVSAASADNGSVSVSPKSAAKGDTVTITVKPDSGYELDKLTVTDKSGDTVKVTEKNGKYTFTMPASKVTVNASFVKTQEETPSSTGFADVADGAYYANAVKWAVEKGITSGTSTNRFSPDATCTRAQTVTFLWRAAGSPAPTGTENPFTDVKSSDYYYSAVLWAVEKGITSGTSADTFSPDATVTRGQTVTFLYRAAGSPAITGSASFGDVSADAYYADAVQWAVSEGVTSGTGNNAFSPAADCTRGQIVTFLYQANK